MCKNKLKHIVIIGLLVNLSQAYSNSCEEIEVGALGKSHWSSSATDGIKGELVNQITKNDDLFDKISPEVQFDLTDFLEFTLQIDRQVQKNLPLPISGRIGPNDLFSYKVNNQLLLELKAKVDGEFFFSEGNAGTQLTMSSSYIPGQEDSTCETLMRLIDSQTEEGQNLINSACEPRKKGKWTRYYEKTVNFFSGLLGRGLKSLSDSEKNRLYAEDPLAGLKVHSHLGLPLKEEIFYANNGDLAIHDIVEHTTYFGLKPIGLQLPLTGEITPKYYRYRRAFRTTAFKKLYGNKLLVEIEDTVLKGNQLELYRLRPKILKIIKLNFGSSQISNFDKESLLQRFEIDLNKLEGREFLQNIISSLYRPNINLNFNSMIIDFSEYKRAVQADEPIYKDGHGEDKNFNFKFFNLFGGNSRDYSLSDNIKFESKEFSDDEKYLQEKFYNRINLNLGIFEIDKADSNYECRLKLLKNNTVKSNHSLAMFSECTYQNAYTTDDIKNRVSNFLNLSLNGGLHKSDSDKIKNLKFSKKTKLNTYLKLSFNKDHIETIAKATNDEIYNELSSIFFGNKIGNVLAHKYHDLWNRLKPRNGPRTTQREKTVTLNYKFKKCESALARVGIIDKNEEVNFQGSLISNQKNLDGNYSSCYRYYQTAKDVVAIFERIREGVELKNSYESFVDLGVSLERMGLIHGLLVRLAGGIKEENVRYTYIITSPKLDSVIGRTNGKHYTIEESGLGKELTTQLTAEYFPRVNDLRFTVNTCDPNIIWGHFKLKYMVEDRSKIYATFDLRNYSTFADEEVGIVRVPLSEAIKDVQGEYHVPLYFEGAMMSGESHDIFFSLRNKTKLRLTNEFKVYLQALETEEAL